MEGLEPLGDLSEVKDLTIQKNSVIQIGPVKLYPNRVTFTKDATLDDGRVAGIYIQHQQKADLWWVGEWALAMESKFGEEGSQYVSSEHWTEDTMKRARWVCERIEHERRVAQLSFDHHAAVAGLPDKKAQDRWLKRAAEKGLSVRDLRRAMRQKAHKERFIEQDLPQGRYRLFYVDFPWAFNDSGFTNDADAYQKAARHYPTMSMDEILSMADTIKEISAREAVLALWVPVPLIPSACEVIERAGYIYKTEYIWHKVGESGKGQNTASHYSKLEHEVLMIATRGSMSPDMDVAMRFPSVQEYPRPVGDDGSQIHSRKPEEFRTMLDTLWPTITKTRPDRIEFFARYKADGWDQFGNESLQGDAKANAANDDTLRDDAAVNLIAAEEDSKTVQTPEGPARLVRGNKTKKAAELAAAV